MSFLSHISILLFSLGGLQDTKFKKHFGGGSQSLLCTLTFHRCDYVSWELSCPFSQGDLFMSLSVIFWHFVEYLAAPDDF